MNPIFSPAWWPVLALASPAIVPVLAWKDVRFRAERRAAEARNAARARSMVALEELPQLEYLELTPLVDHAHAEGFLGDPGVACWIRTDRGSVLLDVAFGASRPALAHNARRLGFTLSKVDAVVLSHPHPDHMGGVSAARQLEVTVPRDLADAAPPLHAPVACRMGARAATVADRPRVVAAGLATTGPLSRALFLEGGVEEQALVGRVRGKGTVVVTGCGHPGLDVLLEVARRVAPGRIHAVVGGLHYPLTGSRWEANGIALQRLFGTGKPPWSPISDADLDRAVALLEEAGVERLLVSAHDSCDRAIERLRSELSAEVDVLVAGRTVRL